MTDRFSARQVDGGDLMGGSIGFEKMLLPKRDGYAGQAHGCPV
jgi:hypothetical protein